MTKLKTVLLGSVTAIAVTTGAQAADMMMDVKAPREPVYRCDVTGFIELPGTDICFKVGGYAMLVAYASEDQWDAFGTGAAYGIVPDGHTLEDTTGMYAVGRVNFDARTSTEYGTVRAYVEMQAVDNDSRTGGSFDLRHAFVQFGNWTFGKTWSTFLNLESSPVYTDLLTVTGDNFMRRNQIRYTQSFGRGFSVSIAVEDQDYTTPSAITAAGLFAPVWGFCGGGCAVVSNRNDVPDVVANIKAEGDWGSAQLSGALHNNAFRDVFLGSAPAPVPGSQTDSEIGWAALFGLLVNTPATGEGDYVTFKAIYTDGATQYNQDNFLWTTNTVWGACNWVVPANGDCAVDTVTTWSVLASFTHNWSPTWSSTVGAGYQNVSAPMTVFNAGVPSLSSDFDMDTYEIFGNVSWMPVNNLTIMFGVHYGHVDFNGAGTTPAGGFDPFTANPAAADDQGALAVALDIVRSF